ncbi:carbohydrate ABC transporter permease [Alteribacter populi]|uniref:carbohydrate ABC transporter permease n=1 Tax=Alteribacter populi TaxID=2011011 RepID=UPI000BBB27DC|nr:carbohydrate ABC transporter permease [Alteribacter populi]
MRKRKITWFTIVNTSFMLLMVLVMTYPFIHMTAVSLSADYYVMRGEVSFWPKGFTTGVYEQVLQNSRIHTGYINTIIYVVTGTSLSLAVTAMGAYALSRKQLVWRGGFSFMIVFTMLFSGGMIPTFLVVRELGIIDTRWAMILPSAVSAWNFFVMRTFFANLPVELEESGKIDGLNDIGIFWRIMLPLSKPVLATIGLFYLVFIWNNFMNSLLYLRSEELYPLQMILRNIVMQGQMEQSVDGNEEGIALTIQYATILVSTVPVLCVYPFIQKYFVKGALLGSVKG